MPKLKAIHQLVVNGEKATDPSRVIQPGDEVTVSAEDAERFVSLGAAIAVVEEKKKSGKTDPVKDDGGLV